MSEQLSPDEPLPLLGYDEAKVYKPNPEYLGRREYAGIWYGRYLGPDGSQFCVMESDDV